MPSTERDERKTAYNEHVERCSCPENDHEYEWSRVPWRLTSRSWLITHGLTRGVVRNEDGSREGVLGYNGEEVQLVDLDEWKDWIEKNGYPKDMRRTWMGSCYHYQDPHYADPHDQQCYWHYVVHTHTDLLWGRRAHEALDMLESDMLAARDLNSL